ncbi:hypothetical protein [Hymenobacter cellulosivorans]|uniref:Uncharacterized protein n=1 Tax=Hymenobacter cellulosivorans TaxID=2932249 RepID=A0ABY4FGQ4_9BACT|nr:hypothetical protein [Hymenobacter cellulosivorans]UOQ53636.1 hypothetical protein MUN80_02495 [Hymenobacter cellulosivorans]
MNDTTLAQQMVVAAPAAPRNVNLNLHTDPKRMAIIKVWDAMFHRHLVDLFPERPATTGRSTFKTVRAYAPIV